MLIDVLKKVVENGRIQNFPVEYIKIELKETLIYYALDGIYNSPQWNTLVFGGGTALKMIGNTARLSEDLDMDYMEDTFDGEGFMRHLLGYFKNIGIENLTITAKNSGKIITVKFPVLHQLGLIKNIKNESDFLYLKIEVEKNKYSNYSLNATPLIKNNLFFIVKNYDLETLFANKIGAILGRKNKTYHNKYDFKGRDFYDLMWFLEKGVFPNLERAQQIITAEQQRRVENYSDIWALIRQRILNIDTKGIYVDMKHLVRQQQGIKTLADNYLDIYDALVQKLQS